MCWGSNSAGQLGDGSTSRISSSPVVVAGLASDVRTIATGDTHSCAVTNGGGVFCWGNNEYGQLGDGTTFNRYAPVLAGPRSPTPTATAAPAALVATGNVTAIAVGDFHTCALSKAGGVKCWGQNSSGQLGNGSTVDSSVPVQVSGLSKGVAAISVGGNHSCVLTTGGGVRCWGDNAHGELGNGTTKDSLVPVDVTSLTSGVTAIAVGGEHTCALTSLGGVKCWGYNANGQLGNGSRTDSSVPVDVSGLTSGVTASPLVACICLRSPPRALSRHGVATALVNWAMARRRIPTFQSMCRALPPESSPLPPDMPTRVQSATLAD